MKFTVSSTLLNAKLSTLSKAISSKNTIQVLDCIKFEVGADLVLTASDNTNMAKVTMPHEGADGSGMFCVQAKTILSMVKDMADQPLSFEVDMNTYAIKMRYQNGSFKIVGQTAEEYPTMQGLEGECSEFVLPARKLLNVVERSMFATADDELRMVMNGLYFDLNGDHLAVVATDGRMLVRNRIFTCKSDTPKGFILPKKPATLMCSMVASDDNDVRVRFNDSNAEIIFNDGVIACRLIEGRYPNYNAVIPQSNPNVAHLDRKSLQLVLKRIMPFSSDATGLVKFRFGANEVELNAEDIDFSTSAKEKMMCGYEGTPMEIGFKGSAMGEICKALSSDDIEIQMSEPNRAGVIFPCTQPDDEEILMLAMPMLIN